MAVAQIPSARTPQEPTLKNRGWGTQIHSSVFTSGPPARQKLSGISCRAVCFLAGFHHADDVGLHVVHSFLGAPRPPLAGRCRIIQALFRSTSDVAACFLS